MIINSLTFWTLVCGLLAFVAKFFFPAFPLETGDILALTLFFLGLFGVVPSIRAARALTANIVNSLAFWQLVAGLVFFVLRFFAPDFPLDVNAVLGIIMFVLAIFNIYPELRMRGKLKE